MPFDKKESLMYYNEIISNRPGKALRFDIVFFYFLYMNFLENDKPDDTYLSKVTSKNKQKAKKKADMNKGHGLHSIKKKRRVS